MSLIGLRERFATSPLARRLLGGAAWSVAGAIFSSGTNLLLMIAVARVFGKESYGKFVMLQSTIGTVGVFAGIGIGATAVRYVAELKYRDPQRLARILTLTETVLLSCGLVASIAVFGVSPFISSTVLNADDLALPLSLAACTILFSALDGYHKSVLIGFESMRSLAIGTCVATVFTVPVMIIMSKAWGLNGAAGALTMNAFMQCAISRYQMSRTIKEHVISSHVKGFFQEWRVLRDFSLPSLLSSLLVLPAHWACNTMLANTQNGYAEIAIIGIAMQWYNAIIFLPSVAGRMVLPVLTDQLSNENKPQAFKVIKLAITLNVGIAVPVAIVISVLSPWIMRFYGNQYQNNWQSLAIISFISIIVIGAMPVGQMLAAGNKMWLGTYMNAGWAIVYIGSSFYFLNLGALGIVISLGLAYLLHSIWVGLFAIKYMSSLNMSIPKTSEIEGAGV